MPSVIVQLRFNMLLYELILDNYDIPLIICKTYYLEFLIQLVTCLYYVIHNHFSITRILDTSLWQIIQCMKSVPRYN